MDRAAGGLSTCAGCLPAIGTAAASFLLAGTPPLSDLDDPLFRLDAGQETRASWAFKPEDALIGGYKVR